MADDSFDDGLAALSRFFVSDGTLGDTLTRVAELACLAGPADMAGLTMLVEGHASTGVFTDAEAPEIDQAQYRTGRGPCLDAFRKGEVFRIADTVDDTNWPEFAAAAAARGIRSTLSLPVTARGESLGALNLYAREPDAFDDTSAARLETFARQSAFVLVNAQAYWDARRDRRMSLSNITPSWQLPRPCVSVLKPRLAYVSTIVFGREDTWALAQIDRCVSALADDRYATHVPTDGRSVDEVVEAIASHAGLTLEKPRLAPARYELRRLAVGVRHIRF